MRDRHFMEDENELPYLVWEKTDKPHSKSRPNQYYASNEKEKSDEEKLDEVMNSVYISVSDYFIVKNKLKSLLKAKDCTSLTVVTLAVNYYTFVFTRENEYIKTTDEFIYDSQFEGMKRIFLDCDTRHNHDNLINNPRFQDMVKRSGMEFISCSGGYVTEYSMKDDEFNFRDEIDLKVIFKVGSKKRFYKLDLDRMKLSKDYNEYSI